MVLKNLQIYTQETGHDKVALYDFDGMQMVVAVITTTVLEQCFRHRGLTEVQAKSLVESNIEAFASIISAKYERDEYQRGSSPDSPSGRKPLRVNITLEDIETSGKTLTPRALTDIMQPWWGSPGGPTSPA